MRSIRLPGNTAVRMALLLLMMLFAGCEELFNENRTAVFMLNYVNYAWGYQNNGYIIDSEGVVKEFNLPENWNYVDDEGYISEADMAENILRAGNTVCIISKSDMAYFSARLRSAVKGKITEPEHRMCDAGATVYAGFLYEPGNSRYRYVFIRQTGDFYTENLSKDAAAIYEWMQDPCAGNLSVKLR
jgi:hypothetical protein